MVFALLLLWMRQELKTGYWFCALAKFFGYGTNCTAIFCFFFWEESWIPSVCPKWHFHLPQTMKMCAQWRKKTQTKLCQNEFFETKLCFQCIVFVLSMGCTTFGWLYTFIFSKISRSTIKYRKNKTNWMNCQPPMRAHSHWANSYGGGKKDAWLQNPCDIQIHAIQRVS